MDHNFLFYLGFLNILKFEIKIKSILTMKSKLNCLYAYIGTKLLFIYSDFKKTMINIIDPFKINSSIRL